jgi:hypothetical protein
VALLWNALGPTNRTTRLFWTDLSDLIGPPLRQVEPDRLHNISTTEEDGIPWERLVNVHLSVPFVSRLIATGPCLNAQSRSITEEMLLRCLLDHKGKRPGKTANMNMACTWAVDNGSSCGDSMPVFRVRHKSADSVPDALGGRASEFISVLRRSSVKIVKWLASASHPQNPGLWLAAPTCANLTSVY